MDIDLIKSLIEERLTIPQIGERIGKSESSVRRLLKKYNLKTFRYINENIDLQEKTCRYCQTKKNIQEFPVASTIKGKVYYRNKCNKCYVAMKRKRRNNIQTWFKNLKKTLSCSHCGNNDFRVIQFHHKDDNKQNNIGSMIGSFSKENVLKEIEKCIPLCANCHIILHYEENNW